MGDDIKVEQTDAGVVGNTIGSIFNLYDNYTATRTTSDGRKIVKGGKTKAEAVANTYKE
ncbi:MAG: hypothetical protein PVH61_08415 [Candidatus Aminicenantes bacterium]|jgi:hypothetical protein